jgi:hypothetical protein
MQSNDFHPIQNIYGYIISDNYPKEVYFTFSLCIDKANEPSANDLRSTFNNYKCYYIKHSTKYSKIHQISF